MATSIQEIQSHTLTPHWSLTTRIAFRFCLVYFGLFCFATQVLDGLFPIPDAEIPELATLWPIRQITEWTAAHILRIPYPLTSAPTGSGDKTFDWVLSFCLLVSAVVATGVWSFLDRKRENLAGLHKWFRLFIRFALAAQMLSYGIAKVVPLQMPFPSLMRLVEPAGNFSPMGVLWFSVGASPPYEIFAGCAEVLAGLLLIFPRTTMFGALVCLADAIQVFMLNMTYDVPVKLFSFHLIVMALFLLAPDLPRLTNFFFLDLPVGSSTQPRLFGKPQANRVAFIAQVVFGMWILGMNVYGSWSAWHTEGEGRPKSPLYGIWNVEQLVSDGQLRSPLLTDSGRWRRAIFDAPTWMVFQRGDDSFSRYGVSINLNEKTLDLRKGNDTTWKARFAFQRDAADRLTLHGEMDGHKVDMQLNLVDRNQFLLVNRGFHWIQERPFNR